MTTAEHAQSARTGTCPTTDELKQYLAGWSDETQAEQLERHLQLCPVCEAAIGQMETRPDTLLQSLQSTVAAPVASPVARSVSDRDSAAPDSEASSPPENDSPINAALAKAKQLMDAPVETAADKARTAWQPMQRELGMYELLKPLGRGGMGAVYLATHKQLKKQVAIKLLPILSSEDSDVRARFDREIRVVGKLNHPSIVTATDAGEIDGTQFLVMEYVPGLDLSRLARLMGRLPVADACELIRQAALGLSCAHAEGVVHRDVKPSNLMLDESGQIRILDFGLAQLSVWDEASVDLTTVGQLMGTLDYMAPEQAEVSSGVDYRADLYALGATLFRLLCGRAPLAAAPNQSPFEKLRLLANHQPPKLGTLCPEAPEELVKLVASLLSRNPSDRPASAAHVAEQLAPFAEGSKLVELLQQAQAKAALSPELLKKSVFPDHPPFLSPALAPLAPLPATSGGGRSKILRRLLLAASLPVLIIAGILIKLETSKGQLVIESDVDNVSVKLLKDGKPVDGIQVSHGTTSTRLNADNYEITIDGPSDSLVIDNDKFTLKNGETVVARITRTPDFSNSAVVEAVRPAGETATSITFADPVQAMKHKLQELSVELELQRQKLGDDHPRVSGLEYEIELRQVQLDKLAEAEHIATKSPPTESPLYDGQPLSYWLAALKTDRSPAKQLECFEAIRRLADVANSIEVTTGLTEFLRADFGDERDASIDELGFQCIARLNPDQRFLAWWMKEFQTGDEAWQTRLAGLGSHLKFSSGDQLAEFEHWVKTEKAQNKLSPQNVKHVADFVAKIGSTSECSRQVSDRLVQLLDDMTTDDRSWWLAAPHQVRFGKLSDRYEFLQLFAIRSCQITSDVIGNPESSSTQIVQAAMVFHSHRNHWPMDSSSAKPVGHLWELYSEPYRNRFLKAADGYLKRVLNDPASMTEFIRVPQEFDHEARYQHFSIASRYKIKFSHEMMQNGGGPDHAPDRSSNALIEVLDAIYLYDSGNWLRSGAPVLVGQPASIHVPVEVADSVKALRSRLHSSLPQLEFNGLQVAVVLEWPQMTPAGAFFGGASSAEIWGDQTPTEDDWLRLCLLGHEVLNAPVVGKRFPDLSTTAADSSIPATPAETPSAMSNAPATPAPLYEGKPLEHWLDMLSRERSVVGLKAAIDGCTALVDEENAGAVTDALLKVLPSLDGELQVTDKETNSVWTLDFEGGKLLRKANPGSKFFEVWVNARSKSAAGKWNERLMKLAIYRTPESADDLMPLLQWARSVLLGANDSVNADQNEKSQAVDHAAILLRGFVATSSLGMNASFVDSVVPILVESPKLDDRWWLSEPLMSPGRNGRMTEIWPAPIKAKISETAVRVLEKAESDSSATVQACMILANNAVLTDEQKATVLTVIQGRLENVSKSQEALAQMVPVKGSFSELSIPHVGNSTGLRFIGLRLQLGTKPSVSSLDWNAAVVLQLLDVVTAIDQDKRCQPQVQMIFESSRDVFEIVNAQRLAEIEGREKIGLQSRQSNRLPLDLYWPALTTNVDASTPIRPGSPDGLKTMAFKTLWGEHKPSKQDWLKYLILLHPAMQDVVTAEIEKSM